MNSTPVRVVGFVAAVAAVFGIAVGVGRAVGPTTQAVSTHGPAHDAPAMDRQQAAAATAGGQTTAPAETPGGLMVSQHGYSLRLADDRAAAGPDVPVAFTVQSPAGRPVTEYAVAHEKRLHLIAVRRDFTGFQHVHPRLADPGVWSARLDLTPGQWRLFADFQVAGGRPLTLGADLAVAGEYRPAARPGESRTARVDGYTVTLDGELAPGADAKLTLTVSMNGRPVTDLQPYLGAYGHLVALREGDMAYLHVHPDGHPGDGSTEPGPGVSFYAAVPSAGVYRLFLDFKHQGVVRTAAFAVTAAGGHEPDGNAGPDTDGHNGH